MQPLSPPLARTHRPSLTLAARLALLSAGVRFDQRCALPSLPAEVEAALSLSLREAVTNVIRHARANSVEIDCASIEGGLRVTVSDDGRGGVQMFGNGLTAQTVAADAQGIAVATYTPTGGVSEDVNILAASPVASGQVRFLVMIARPSAADSAAAAPVAQR